MIKPSISTLKKIIKESVSQVFQQTNLVNEAGLSRIHQHMQNYECAFITAWRTNPLKGDGCLNPKFGLDNKRFYHVKPTPKKSSHPSQKSFGQSRSIINAGNNAKLKAMLLDKGYQVIDVSGRFIEALGKPGEVPVQERSFMVMNVNDDSDFRETIIALGRRFCQDSVIVVDKGGEPATLYGTNNVQPGNGVSFQLDGLKLGEKGEFMTQIKGRPFKFSAQRSLTSDEEKYFNPRDEKNG
jgi:hypothetical protein